MSGEVRAAAVKLSEFPKRWVGRRGVTVRIGGVRYMLLKSSEYGRTESGPAFLYLIRRDFRDVLFMVRWPRRWWPF